MTLEAFKESYDWRHAFHEAFNGCYGAVGDDDPPGPIENVVKVYASSEGENDGPDWLAAVKLKDGRFAAVRAGCDYTGWD